MASAFRLTAFDEVQGKFSYMWDSETVEGPFDLFRISLLACCMLGNSFFSLPSSTTQYYHFAKYLSRRKLGCEKKNYH
jgi:hypothetical protein